MPTLFRCFSSTVPGMRRGVGMSTFLSFFADKGYRALAVSLRGHGNSSTDKPLRACSVADYVAGHQRGCRQSAHTTGGRRSLHGRFVVQKYLEAHDCPAGVLMTSMPPQGNLGSALRWMRQHPWHFSKMTITGKALPYISTPQLARERFFSAQMPESHVVDYAARLQEDSSRVGIDCLVLNLPRPKRVRTPLLVLGADEDGAHTPKKSLRPRAHIAPKQNSSPAWVTT